MSIPSNPAAVRIMAIIGTRPEAIKMAPVIAALTRRQGIACFVCSTGQHSTMLSDVLADLGFPTDCDLAIMNDSPTLAEGFSTALQRLDKVIADFQPDWVIVQGDTTSAAAGAIAAFLRKVKVGHIEAGLRTGSTYDPFPEEAYRKMISTVATLHFAPTEEARGNLLRENIPAAAIHVTGNTVIDALYAMQTRLTAPPLSSLIAREFAWLAESRPRTILVTMHRRENFGEGLEQLCAALLDLASGSDVTIIFPVHLNPAVHNLIYARLGRKPYIHLLAPQPYSHFVYLMNKASLVITDSGGIQEECTALGLPALVIRNTTERPEGLRTGLTKLVSTSAADIVAEVRRVLHDSSAHDETSPSATPYGDGHAGERIAKALLA